MARPDQQEIKELLKEVRRIRVQSSRLVAGVMAGGYSSVFRGTGIEFHDVLERDDLDFGAALGDGARRVLHARQRNVAGRFPSVAEHDQVLAHAASGSRRERCASSTRR